MPSSKGSFFRFLADQGEGANAPAVGGKGLPPNFPPLVLANFFPPKEAASRSLRSSSPISPPLNQPRIKLADIATSKPNLIFSSKIVLLNPRI